MRRFMGMLVVSSLLACKGDGPTPYHSDAPLEFYTSAKFTVVVANGTPDLEVSVTLTNRATTHLQAFETASCPFTVGIAPSPGTQPYTGVFGCPPGAAQVDVAPGDSTVLTGTISGDTLATFSAGTYQVNIQVVTNYGGISLWAGTIQLPLAQAPSLAVGNRRAN